MTAGIHHSSGRRRAARGRVAAELTLGVLPLGAACGAAAWTLGLPAGYLVRAGLLYALLAALVYRRRPRATRAGLGPANLVTLSRAGVVLAIAALLPHPVLETATGGWWVIGLATVAMVLDGVDGQVARHTGTATRFGARFDMELDSLLMLVLATAVWQSGRLGPWVVLLGLPRYLFVAAGWRWRWLTAPLPERMRRKAGCVLQGVALLVSLAPIVDVTPAGVVASTALVLLVSSFLVDVAWLWRRRPAARQR